MRLRLARLEQLPGAHGELLDDGTEGERGEESQTADDQDHADQQPDEQSTMGREGAGRGREASSWPPTTQQSPWPEQS